MRRHLHICSDGEKSPKPSLSHSMAMMSGPWRALGRKPLRSPSAMHSADRNSKSGDTHRHAERTPTAIFLRENIGSLSAVECNDRFPPIAVVNLSLVIPAKAGTQYPFHMRHEFGPCVYILASKRNGTLYTGVTSHLPGRIHQHRIGAVRGFTREYGVRMLVWFEQHSTMEAAILREKRIKKWNRAWKLQLIESGNPDWRDLAEDLGFEALV